jgi:hypothetical protein
MPVGIPEIGLTGEPKRIGVIWNWAAAVAAQTIGRRTVKIKLERFMVMPLSTLLV